MRPQSPRPLDRAAPFPALGFLPVINGQTDLAEFAVEAELSSPALPEGETLALFIGELLEAFWQPLRHPFAAFGRNFTFDLGKTGESLGRWFHGMTRIALWFALCCR